MRTARDQFADDIYTADRAHKNDPVDLTIHYSYIIADELIAAGYRKPRVVTTADEMDKLRFHAVVLDAYGTPYVCERHRTDGTRNEWQPSGMNHLEESDSLLFHGDVTVLYEGEPKP